MIRGSHNGCPHWQSDRSPDIPTRKISVSQTPVFINGEQIFGWERQWGKEEKRLLGQVYIPLRSVHNRMSCTLGEPPRFWLDKNARGLSLSAEPK